jgi:hypothetical protein
LFACMGELPPSIRSLRQPLKRPVCCCARAPCPAVCLAMVTLLARNQKPGDASMDIGISEEVVQAALVFFARKTSNGHYLALENGHTKQRSQTGNPCHGHNKSLSTVYPHSML